MKVRMLNQMEATLVQSSSGVLKNSILAETDLEADCIQRSLENFQTQLEESKYFLGGYCNATWDSIYCWPFAPAGVTITRSCEEVMRNSSDLNSEQISLVTGNAVRICNENGSWLWGNWTNYSECLQNLREDSPNDGGQNDGVVEAVRWILFLGSIFSIFSLSISLFIFYHFRCLRCDRVSVHIHLMLSLGLRLILFILITEPFIFHRNENYRNVDWICKGVTCLLMYATVASINWMFIQGHYLHARLTTNIFDKGTPFKVYYLIGWGFPLVLLIIWAVTMDTMHQVHCWQNYSQLPYIWILVGPMICALFVNLLFLVNIVRILLTKIQRTNSSSDSAQFRRAVKATLILFPLLGINNLLFVYNPGGGYENVYMLSNAILQSTQGTFVSLLYCFCSHDVRQAIRREYRRYTVRRSANLVRERSRANPVTRSSVMFLTTPKVTIPRRGRKGERNLTPSPDSQRSFYQEETSQKTPERFPLTGIKDITNKMVSTFEETSQCGN